MQWLGLGFWNAVYFIPSGDDKLTLYERNLLQRLKPSELCAVEGSVLAICWQGNFVAWASHLGVRVYDLSEKCSLGLMKWEAPIDQRLESFRCHLRWSNANTLIIGWVDTIRICIIRKRNSLEVSAGNLPGFVVDPSGCIPLAFVNFIAYLFFILIFSFHLSNNIQHLWLSSADRQPTGSVGPSKGA